jgi:two-component system sensor histidine kinase KdpD
MAEADKRPNPDELLARLEAEALQAKRGKLKIFFGASPGVGKTYAMLSAARLLLQQGVDLVVGVVETHGRAETAALVRGLEILPPQVIDYKGRKLKEFDLEAALKRQPALILMDELAHSNAPGSRHPKRWQDIEELLNAGIDVLTTVNVQHLERLNDVIGGITGVKVWETVPDQVFDDADEIVLVDLPHEELLQRLQEGKVYIPQQAERAMQHFFRKGNLLALRELALRRTADRVDDDVLAYRKEQSVIPVWPTQQSLLVCLGASPGSKRLVRAGARLAALFNVPWHVIYVETPKLQRLPKADRARILNTLKLAQDLGATTASLSGHDPVDATVAYAREHNLGKVVVGREVARLLLWQRSFAEKLAWAGPELEVVLVAKETGDRESGQAATVEQHPGELKRIGSRYLWATGVVALVAFAATPLLPDLDLTNIAIVFLLAAVFCAYQFGRNPGVFAAFLSVAVFDFFFVPPRFTFAVSDVQYLLTFLVMLVVALLIGQLTVNLKFQATVAENRERRIRALFEMARELSSTLATVQIAAISERFIQRVFGVRSVILALDDKDKLAIVGNPEVLPELDMGIAHWALDRNQPAGLSTSTLPSAPALYLPLKAPMRTRGVLVLVPGGEQWTLIPEQQRLLDTSSTLIAIALERVHFIEIAQDALVQMESERLRNSLLSALSHDLRTPLTVLTGLSDSLSLAEPALPKEQAEVVQVIREEALRMSALVSNLLDMARLQSGEVKINRDWQPLEEVIGVAMQSRIHLLSRHVVKVRIPADLPLLYFDTVLMERVFCNLLENAAKYTPLGSTIRLSARKSHDDWVDILVEDNGPGLPVGKEEAIFAKFTRGKNESAITGVGLGLSIARAIIEAHGGTLRAENRLEGGARFIIRLPAGQPPEVPQEEMA